jgi:hypothetical protein
MAANTPVDVQFVNVCCVTLEKKVAANPGADYATGRIGPKRIPRP